MLNLPDKQEVLQIVKGIGEDCQTLVRQEAMLLRAELKQDARQVAKIGAKMAAGGVVAGAGSILLALAPVYALSWLFPEFPLWASFAVVGLVLVVAGGMVLARARAQAKELELTPTQTLKSVQKDLRLLAPGT